MRVVWKLHHSNEPVIIYSELDDNRFEVRKIEIFGDGRCGYASPDGGSNGTKLGLIAVPDMSEIAEDAQFEPVEISYEDFELVWASRDR